MTPKHKSVLKAIAFFLFAFFIFFVTAYLGKPLLTMVEDPVAFRALVEEKGLYARLLFLCESVTSHRQLTFVAGPRFLLDGVALENSVSDNSLFPKSELILRHLRISFLWDCSIPGTSHPSIPVSLHHRGFPGG